MNRARIVGTEEIVKADVLLELYPNYNELEFECIDEKCSVRMAPSCIKKMDRRRPHFKKYRNKEHVEDCEYSSENRTIYENIVLQKGLSIIDMIQGEVKPNLRPLGLINPSYKTFGLGTHFFTWRNIPNNSPLVFWWQVQGHNLQPLFPVANRG